MSLDLSGAWRAAPADDELRRVFAESDHDDRHWATVDVPGHWRSSEAFVDHDGPLLYRTTFEHDGTSDGRRSWLRFDGVFYQGDVFLDGGYVGDTEGYFAPHSFEVTDLLQARSEHTLAVEVGCSPQTGRTTKRNITGSFQHFADAGDPAWNPGGLWAGVAVVETGPVRIASLRTRCIEATDEHAVVSFRAVLDAADGMPVTIRTAIGGTDVGEDHTLASGDNVVEWRVTVERPRLWWPRALGEATLHDVVVQIVLHADDATISDERRFRTGLRTVEMRNWQLRVNGERLFLKGANQGPTRLAIADATPEECRRPVELACGAGLDFLRLHSHVARPETYAAADEAGLLLWQDFPLQWGYARQIRKQAVRQATQMVELLGHHPSVAVWCGHNEPFGLEVEPGLFGDADARRVLSRRYLTQQQLPTWNKTVLDRSVKRAIDKADGSRPTIAHSGVLPHLPALDGTDSHLWFGWLWGDERDLPGAARALPRLFRFVSEFGAQAVPDTDDFVDAEQWPNLDWDRLVEVHGLQRALLEEQVPVADHATYDGWKQATQQYQAEVVKHHVETLRRLKFHPTGGFAVFCLSDGEPVISRSLVDNHGLPKPAYDALAAACRPVISVADRLPAVVRPGDALALDIHVVSDLRSAHSGTIDVQLDWKGGGHAWHFGGDIGPDDCVRVGTIQFEVPETDGDLRLAITGRVGTESIDNGYVARIDAS